MILARVLSCGLSLSGPHMTTSRWSPAHDDPAGLRVTERTSCGTLAQCADGCPLTWFRYLLGLKLKVLDVAWARVVEDVGRQEVRTPVAAKGLGVQAC